MEMDSTISPWALANLFSAGTIAEIYVIYGGATRLQSLDDAAPAQRDGVIDLADVPGVNGLVLTGPAEDFTGIDIDSAGDINGDGFADFAVGAAYADGETVGDNSGTTYLVFGGPQRLAALDALDGSVNGRSSLPLLNRTTGYMLHGFPSSVAGFDVGAAGDVNGDGYDDLLVGAPEDGNTFIVFGGEGHLAAADNRSGADGHIDLTTVTGADGYFIKPTQSDDLHGGHGGFTGMSVSRAGDVNGDGFDDLIIGRPQVNGPAGEYSGEAYLLFGGDHLQQLDDPLEDQRDGFLTLTDLNGTNGVVLRAAVAESVAGLEVASAGDVNGDGFDDVLVSAINEQRATSRGTAYVVYGRATWSSAQPGIVGGQPAGAARSIR